jgi:hypothetical protein
MAKGVNPSEFYRPHDGVLVYIVSGCELLMAAGEQIFYYGAVHAESVWFVILN